VRFFGNEANAYVDYLEKPWAKEKFSGGCPVCNVSSSGVMRDYVRAAREPFLNVHFCGTETATVWQGYMDGAAESGERAANEVLHKLFKVSDSTIKIDYDKTYYYQKSLAKKMQQK
jgi:monoamine oxidase